MDEVIAATTAKLGEKISVRRFIRCAQQAMLLLLLGPAHQLCPADGTAKGSEMITCLLIYKLQHSLCCALKLGQALAGRGTQ